MQYLKNRLGQHTSDVKLKNEDTALCSHAVSLQHTFDFKKAMVLAHEENSESSKKRKIRETVEIIKDSNTINYKTDSNNNISNMYLPAIRRIRS